jgi:hypothetical protein
MSDGLTAPTKEIEIFENKKSKACGQDTYDQIIFFPVGRRCFDTDPHKIIYGNEPK